VRQLCFMLPMAEVTIVSKVHCHLLCVGNINCSLKFSSDLV
jgi:hypothetical protein